MRATVSSTDRRLPPPDSQLSVQFPPEAHKTSPVNTLPVVGIDQSRGWQGQGSNLPGPTVHLETSFNPANTGQSFWQNSQNQWRAASPSSYWDQPKSMYQDEFINVIHFIRRPVVEVGGFLRLYCKVNFQNKTDYPIEYFVFKMVADQSKFVTEPSCQDLSQEPTIRVAKEGCRQQQVTNHIHQATC